LKFNNNYYSARLLKFDIVTFCLNLEEK